MNDHQLLCFLTVLLTLRDDPRPEILTLRQVFTEVYGERIKALLP